jgi:hypothetical protein
MTQSEVCRVLQLLLRPTREQKEQSHWDCMKQISPIICADGFKVSVQASSMHYCSPKDNLGPYTTVELGYPSTEEELFMPYCKEPNSPTQTVYACVPLKLVTQAILKHGGLA